MRSLILSVLAAALLTAPTAHAARPHKILAENNRLARSHRSIDPVSHLARKLSLSEGMLLQAQDGTCIWTQSGKLYFRAAGVPSIQSERTPAIADGKTAVFHNTAQGSSYDRQLAAFRERVGDKAKDIFVIFDSAKQKDLDEDGNRPTDLKWLAVAVDADNQLVAMDVARDRY